MLVVFGVRSPSEWPGGGAFIEAKSSESAPTG